MEYIREKDLSTIVIDVKFKYTYTHPWPLICILQTPAPLGVIFSDDDSDGKLKGVI